MAKVFGKAQLAFKIESTPGSFETLSTSEVKFPVFDLDFSPDIEINEREPVREFFGPDQPLAGTRFASVSFKVEMAGSGTATTPPPWGDLLKACRFAETIDTDNVNYDPDSSSESTVSIGILRDGIMYKIAGATGSFNIIGEAGKPAVIEFTFVGVYLGYDDQSLFDATYPTVQPPLVLGASIDIGGDTPIISKFEITVENENSKEVSCGSSSGGVRTLITNRKISLKLDPEMVAKSTRDWFAKLTGTDTEQASIQWGSSAGNTFTLTMPSVKVTSLGDAEREGIYVNEVEFMVLPDSGNDELEIKQS